MVSANTNFLNLNYYHMGGPFLSINANPYQEIVERKTSSCFNKFCKSQGEK
jgi:hypothetical protein